MQQDVLYHFSVIVVRPHLSRHLLIGVYDNTYPLELYRGRVNFFGGNQHPEDQSPRGILEREIREEFIVETTREHEIEPLIQGHTGKGLGAQVPKEFAPARDIAALRNALLSSCKPYKDFLIDAPHKHLPGNLPRFLTICSAFEGSLDESLFECAREHLAHGRAIKSEGFATIVSINDLKKGMPLAAGPASFILSHFLQSKIPDPY